MGCGSDVQGGAEVAELSRQSFALEATRGEVMIYSDSMASGWSESHWGSTVDSAAIATVHRGKNAISVTFDEASAGLALVSSSAIDASTYDTVRFWIHGGASGGQDVSLLLRDGAGNFGSPVPISVPADTWKRVDIPLRALGTPAQIKEIRWIEQGGGVQPTFYLDQVSLVRKGELVIFDDAIAPDWNDWSSWDTTASISTDSSSTPAQSGTKSLSVTFDDAWAGLVLRTSPPVSASAFDVVRFWIRGDALGVQDVSLELRDGAGVYGPGVPVSAPGSTWTEIVIPLRDLGNPSQITGLRLKDTGGGSHTTFYLDQISFGQQKELMVYDDALARSWGEGESWRTTLNMAATYPGQDPDDDAKCIGVTFTAGLGGGVLTTPVPIDARRYDTLRFWINGGTTGGQQLNFYVRNGAGEAGRSVRVNPVPANWWTRIDIPITALGSPTRITSLVWREISGASQPTFYLDRIAFVRDGYPEPLATPVVGGEAVIYDDALRTGWQSWSWGTAVNTASTSPVPADGARAISARFDSKWGALALYAADAAPIDTSLYDHLRFWAHGGSVNHQNIEVFLRGVRNPDDDPNEKTDDFYDGNAIPISAQVKANQWTMVEIPIATMVTSSMGTPAVVAGVIWQDAAGTGGPGSPTFYVDRVSFVRKSAPPAMTAPTLAVNVAAGIRSISPDIYGINGHIEESDAAVLRLPVRRWGGNAVSRYNYTNNATNAGADWYFKNMSRSTSADAFVLQNERTKFVDQGELVHTKTLMTVPLIGWVAKDAEACSFPEASFGPQQSHDSNGCGNGVRAADGTPILLDIPKPPVNETPTSVRAETIFVKGWIEHLVRQHGTAAEGGVEYYNLDNEPGLWHDTHRDVHPAPVEYADYEKLTSMYAKAIKEVDRTAKTLGPVAWGWNEYFYSALDQQCPASNPDCAWWEDPQDRKKYQNKPLVQWYLEQMKKLQDADPESTRFLDYLDLHYYPEAKGLARRPAGAPSTQALRLRSTRSLWDTYYVDESWINEPIRLIPRMRKWVDQSYPGTKLAITEYNFGALDHINGALTQADVLGIFGREGLDLATLWWYSDENQPSFNLTHPAAFAFRMYRNYDGAQNGFGDISVQATSSSHERLSVYAARRSTDNALTLMVINKTGLPLTSPLDLSGFTPSGNAKVYRYGEANLNAIVNVPDVPVSNTGFTATYPANSITLLVIPGA
ncbi:hypothetical protein SCE1572_38325 [Sorangium cellulosum So0157-2]|uniref:Glycoside hydrolase family 44 catalytic domain-containing protein n=2 Tax=Sorangium cellulosum TaxID=56 RepID=S4Y5W7_SORCE|nr:hypothetical protein SCE1572_38325 [Sorangium cellulosum So0157-2]